MTGAGGRKFQEKVWNAMRGGDTKSIRLPPSHVKEEAL